MSISECPSPGKLITEVEERIEDVGPESKDSEWNQRDDWLFWHGLLCAYQRGCVTDEEVWLCLQGERAAGIEDLIEDKFSEYTVSE